ncbi:hypothetical protein R3P38DRAFT_2757767 [Favolaschia claudopus]|uniref:SAP domain-containing protein n=1 Tax=Favolaschia claudopus TaxID=2862362 RepID=A0AAW0EA44_9AGAR
MSSFPWDKLKVPTLRSVCKDIKAPASVSTGSKARMITFLEGVTKTGPVIPTPSADGEKKTTQTRLVMDAVVMPARQRQPPAVSQPLPPAKRALDQPQLEDVNMPGPSSALTFGLDFDDDEPKCAHGCQNGWLSRRTKFVLKVTASYSIDIDRESDGCYIAFTHFPAEYRLKKYEAREGLYVILRAVLDILKEGKVPHVTGVEALVDRVISKDKKKAKFYKAYVKTGASVDDALEALVFRTRDNRQPGDEEAECSDEILAELYGNKWESLPTCPTHDYDWEEVLDALVA